MLFCSTRIPICELIKEGMGHLAHHHSPSSATMPGRYFLIDAGKVVGEVEGKKEGWEGGIYLYLSRNSLTKQNLPIQD